MYFKSVWKEKKAMDKGSMYKKEGVYVLCVLLCALVCLVACCDMYKWTLVACSCMCHCVCVRIVRHKKSKKRRKRQYLKEMTEFFNAILEPFPTFEPNDPFTRQSTVSNTYSK